MCAVFIAGRRNCKKTSGQEFKLLPRSRTTAKTVGRGGTCSYQQSTEEKRSFAAGKDHSSDHLHEVVTGFGYCVKQRLATSSTQATSDSQRIFVQFANLN